MKKQLEPVRKPYKLSESPNATTYKKPNKHRSKMNPTTAQRAAALAAFINADDARQGRPEGFPLRTVADLEIETGHAVGDRILSAYIDNHVGHVPFAVLTEDEAATAKELSLDRDLTEDDCVEVDGTTFVVVCLG